MISPVSISPQEFSEVLERLEQWPPTDRWTLTRRLLDGLGIQPAPLPRPPMTMRSHEVRGILATSTPPPTDEQCQQWLEEERLRKYG